MREGLKWVARMLANVLVSPLVLWYWLWVPLLGTDRSLEGTYQAVSMIPGIFGDYLRRALLTWTIRECHPSATISFGTLFSKSAARLQANTYVGPCCNLGMVCLEQDVLIAAGVHITSGAQTHGHADLTRPIREQPGTLQLVTIGARSWVGSGAIVMADVGADSIIGAGSVVTKPIPSNVIAVGVPAKVVQQRDADPQRVSQ